MSFGQGPSGPFGSPPNNDGGGTGGAGNGNGGGPFGFNPFASNSGNGSGGGAQRGSRPAGGARRGPGRPSALVLTIISVAVLVGLFVLFTGIYTDVLWFNQIGYADVFWTEIWTRAALFLIAGAVMGAAVWAAIWLAWRHRPADANAAARDSLSQYQRQLEPIRRIVFTVVPIVIGLFAGSAAMNGWQTVLLFFNQVPYGQDDPQFGMDLSFYMATLPFISMVSGFITSVILIAGIAGLIVHYLYGSVRVEERGGIVVEKAARIHIGVIAALFLLVQGVNFWMDRYRTLQSQSGGWAGALYTDVNAVIPTSAILAVTALIVAALFVVTIINGKWRLSIVGTAVLIITALVVGTGYPFLVQNYQVQPSERSLEAQYIQRNIDFTREAYGLDEVDVANYEGATQAQAGALAGESANTANIRLMDPNLLSQTFGQLQQFRPYYWFPDTLHVDRYEIDGEMRDTVISVRDVNVSQQQSWVNSHIIYTHGYGVVAADASEVAAGGRPQFLLSGIPTSGALASDSDYEPRIYFGLNSPQYSVVGAPEGATPQERDRPQTADSSEDTAYTFSGEGGPSVGNLFHQLAYAVKFGSPELVLSSDVNSESQILYDRNPVERVEKVAPYLTADTNPYPAIVDGRVKWIVDAYTTSNEFPYSTAQALNEATADALSRNSALALSGQVNYIRNSVKATVDAYDGSVTLYAWEPEDPLLQAWQSVYPNSLQPYSEMSADLMAHVRYPEDMFKVQRELLGRYHVTNPGDFYENNDAWSVPSDPTQGDGNVKQPPYYMTMQMPQQEEPAFSLTSTYIPQITEGTQQRNVLYGFLSADGDAGTGEDGVKKDTYGTLRLLELPRQTTVPGPGQAQANFDSNDTVSQELNLLRQGASEVINGNMITLPVAGGILYVQPVYVRSSGTTSYPTLRKVLVSFGGEKVGFADTLEEALNQVFGGDSGAVTPEEAQEFEDGQTGDEDTTEPGDEQPSTAPAVSGDLAEALQAAQNAINASEEALANGDWAEYGRQQEALNEALTRAIAAQDAAEQAEGAEADAEGDADTQEG
ncbi:MAG: UPF0182 family protein, partial [Micrococcus sp.]|nr:UPF0182 family protein [Micrococcus sp.]